DWSSDVCSSDLMASSLAFLSHNSARRLSGKPGRVLEARGVERSVEAVDREILRLTGKAARNEREHDNTDAEPDRAERDGVDVELSQEIRDDEHADDRSRKVQQCVVSSAGTTLFEPERDDRNVHHDERDERAEVDE